MAVLQIYRDQVDDHGVELSLQGRIVGAWAALLERECLESRQSGSRVVLDLERVVFIGRTGLEALIRLARAGVRIVGCAPLFAAMLEHEGIAVNRTGGRR